MNTIPEDIIKEINGYLKLKDALAFACANKFISRSCYKDNNNKIVEAYKYVVDYNNNQCDYSEDNYFDSSDYSDYDDYVDRLYEEHERLACEEDHENQNIKRFGYNSDECMRIFDDRISRRETVSYMGCTLEEIEPYWYHDSCGEYYTDEEIHEKLCQLVYDDDDQFEYFTLEHHNAYLGLYD